MDEPRRPWWRRKRWVAAGLLLLAGLAVAVALLSRPGGDPRAEADRLASALRRVPAVEVATDPDEGGRVDRTTLSDRRTLAALADLVSAARVDHRDGYPAAGQSVAVGPVTPAPGGPPVTLSLYPHGLMIFERLADDGCFVVRADPRDVYRLYRRLGGRHAVADTDLIPPVP